VARDPSGIDGLILSSPFFGFAIKVPLWKRAAGVLLSRYIPSFSMPTEIEPSSVSHDPKIVEGYATDPLVGRVASSRWFTETKLAHEQLTLLAPQVEMPVLFQQAGEDKLVDGSAGRAVFELFNSPDKTWEDKPGEFHEIWFETNWRPTIETVAQWILTHAARVSKA
ncbi:MAG: alpha/beta hydrolase, partial [Myxococcota bacterium]|nr:alpha/beta hydrolase [Myxococcota bacterium]